jgi:hypothetical protein
MINNNIDLDLVNNKVQVIGIYSSKENAEIKINKLLVPISNNLTPKYIIQGPFIPDNISSASRPIPRSIPRPIPTPHPDIFNPDIFEP